MKKVISLLITLVILSTSVLLAVRTSAFLPIPEMVEYGGKSHGIASALSRDEKCKPENIKLYAEQYSTWHETAMPDLYTIMRYYLEYITGRKLRDCTTAEEEERYGFIYDQSIIEIIRVNNITKEQVRAANARYAADLKTGKFIQGFDARYHDVEHYPPVTDWVIDAWFEPDEYKAAETLISPFYVIGYYRGGEPGSWTRSPIGYEGWEPQTDTIVGLYAFGPNAILGHSLAELETWGYTAEYWLDYYTFLYNRFPVYHHDAYASYETYYQSYIYPTEPSADENENAYYLNGQLYLKYLKKRIDYYTYRIQNPNTGDTLSAAAGVWFAAAMLSLAIPASLAVMGKKRRDSAFN